MSRALNRERTKQANGLDANTESFLLQKVSIFRDYENKSDERSRDFDINWGTKEIEIEIEIGIGMTKDRLLICARRRAQMFAQSITHVRTDISTANITIEVSARTAKWDPRR